MRDKHQIIEEPCEGKLSRTVLETSESREGLAEFNLIKFMSMYGLNSATAASLALARRAMYLSERPPARTADQGTEPRKHVWSYWGSIGKRVKGSSRHSFYTPRPRVYSRLRPVRNGDFQESSLSGDEPTSAVDNSSGELGKAGENPAGSRRTARRRGHA